MTKKTVEEILETPPVWGPIGLDVFERTYFRVKPNGEKENWKETATRVVNGNLAFVDPKYIEKGEREDLLELIYSLKALPAGRHLWITGAGAKAYPMNCWSSYLDKDFSRHFAFTFERLMEGGGVGTNYSNKHLRKYAALNTKVDLHFVCSPEHKDYDLLKHLLSDQYSHQWSGSHTVQDSRSGWVESLAQIIDVCHSQLDSQTLVFDVSNVRAAGLPLKGFGGVASGPKLLVEMLLAVSKKLNGFYGKKPTSLLCMEIDHEIAHCVAAGGSRRSARMSLKHWADSDIMEFIKCKEDKSSHYTTNISVVVDNKFWRAVKQKEKKALAVAKALIKGALHNGEPGMYNVSKASEGEPSEAFVCNPCGEVAFSSGYEPCLPYETKVLTAQGYKEIGDLNESYVDLVVESVTEDMKGPSGIRKGKIFKTGSNEVFKVTTRDNKEITATAGHPFLSYNNQGEKVWKELADLKVGDELISNSASLVNDSNEISTEHYALGYWLGDGWFSVNNGNISIGACGGEPKKEAVEITRSALKLIADKAEVLYPSENKHSLRKDPPEVKPNKNEVYTFAFYRQSLSTHLVNHYGFAKGANASAKALPLAYWEWSLTQKASFLRGLFDSDGGASESERKRFRFTCKNPKLAKEVCTALSEFGIRSRTSIGYPRGESQCELSVKGGDNLARLLQNVYTSNDSMPKYKQERLAVIVDGQRKRTRGGSDKHVIVSIESAGIQETFNIEVPEAHQFIAEGLVTHNCCLGHVNLQAFVGDKTGMYKAFRLMTRFLIRATFAHMQDEESEKIIQKNRRIGVGFFGYHGWLSLQGIKYSESHENAEVRKTLRKAYEIVRKECRNYAFEMRTPEPIKCTVVAPTGSIAQGPGTTTGLQSLLFKYYNRAVLFSTLDPSQNEKIKKYEEKGLKVEDHTKQPHTKVVYFPVKDPLVDAVVAAGYDESIIEDADEIDFDDYLAVQAMVQQEYADNAISLTVNIDPKKYKPAQILRHLQTWGPRLKGTTIMPFISNRPHMPFTKITTEEWEQSQLKEIGQAEIECKNGACPIK